MLMGLTILPVVTEKKPSNLIIIVFDNERYAVLPPGNIPTLTAGPTDLAKTAQGAGIQNSRLVTKLTEFQEAIDEAFQANETSFIVVKVEPGPNPSSFRAEDGIENKYKFIRYIEKTEKRQIIQPLGITRYLKRAEEQPE